MQENAIKLHQFLGPRHWPTWLGLGVMRVLCLLPFSWQLAIGRLLGRVSYYLTARRRKIAEKNIALCFGELTQDEQKALVVQHFENLGMAIFETAFTWWASDSRLADLERIQGIEHIHAALEQGKGVILLSAHFTTLEIGCRLLLLHIPFHPMYRSHENPLFGEIMKASRERLATVAIPRDDVRLLIRTVKQNHAVWYAPDQAYRGKNSAPVPFFGHLAPTNLATSRLAKMTGAPVVPFFSERDKKDKKYVLHILPALEDFPSDNAEFDAARINKAIEDQVRKAPEQYLWAHRRFKASTPDEPDPYEGL